MTLTPTKLPRLQAIQPRDLMAFATEFFPVYRSLTGNGVRRSLELIQQAIPDLPLTVREIPSGTRVLDWEIPLEWNVREAYIANMAGQRVVDFDAHNLHLVGYSEPIDRVVSQEELQAHLHSLPEMPHAIPYVTSYHSRTWGFCVTHAQRQTLTDPSYQVCIRATLEPGSLTLAELVLPGRSSKEIFVSTYICHPAMANNETSGPAVATFLARELASWEDREYTYRFVFLPETIGAIAYVSMRLADLQRNVVAGFNVTCVGNESEHYSYMPSRLGETLADRVAQRVLACLDPGYIRYSFLDRGSDERQYCSPGVDLPVVSIMRSKYGTYPEYHTSLDNLDFISAEGLYGSFCAHRECFQVLEKNRKYRATVLCEPNMGRRGLYPTVSSRDSYDNKTKLMMDFLAYCDGQLDLIEISQILEVSPRSLVPIVDTLMKHSLIQAEGE